MKRRESIPPEGRDQDPTTFAAILQELLWHEPRAEAAVLIDTEGETVDYASSLPSFYTKVAAANLRVVLDDVLAAWGKLASRAGGAAPRGELMHALIRARRRSFFVRPLPDGYALVLLLRRHAFDVSSRAVTLAASRIAREAGWPAPFEEDLPWHPAEVEASRADRFRPKQMNTGKAWENVEVLGSIVKREGEPRRTREKGYRCRLQGGAEITLVREATGVWFVDQPARGLSSHQGPESTPPGALTSQVPSSSQPPGRTNAPAPPSHAPSRSTSPPATRTSPPSTRPASSMTSPSSSPSARPSEPAASANAKPARSGTK